MKIPAIPQEAAKMPWSIDTTLSLISLLLTGTSSVFEIWYYVKHAYRRISFKDSSTEPSIARGRQQPRNVDPEALLESGLHSQNFQMQLGSEPKLSRRTKSA